MSRAQEQKNYVGISLVFIFLTLIAFGFYFERTLKGDINNHILAAEMFGVPSELKDRGVKPLYYGEDQTGWDGQFYYYISNDLLGRKDTPAHIDSPSYRYQRIGLSLFAATAAAITGNDWVSPTTFFISYFALIVAATWFGAGLLSNRGAHPSLILIWSLSVGTQITLFNALPDAAADAFLILALVALCSRRFALAAIPLTMAALSREVYVLFAVFIAGMYLVDLVASKKKGGASWSATLAAILKQRAVYWLALPAILLFSWQVYVRVHFGISPSSQAHGILGPPFAGWYEYLSPGLAGTHELVGESWAYFEAASLIFFMAVLAIAGTLALNVLTKKYGSTTPLVRGVAVTTLVLCTLYACFGSTVSAHYTGYMKAAGVFCILIPFLLADTTFQRVARGAAISLLIVGLMITTYYNWDAKLLKDRNIDEYTKAFAVIPEGEMSCLGSYDADVRVKEITVLKAGLLAPLFGDQYLVVNLLLTNTGRNPLFSTRPGQGSVNMSYHWIDEQGSIAMDGIRSAIPSPIAPGETAEVSVVSKFPRDKGRYTMRLSPVQEGCAWFYQKNPSAAADLKFHVRN